MKRQLTALSLCLLVAPGALAQVPEHAETERAPEREELLDAPHATAQDIRSFEDLRAYLSELSQTHPELPPMSPDPSPYELLGILEQAIELDDFKAQRATLEALRQRAEHWLQAERLDLLEERSDLSSFELNQLQHNLKHIQDQLPFRVFGSLALRSCSMMNTRGEVLGALLQTRLGAGVRGQFHPDWDFGLRLLSIDNQNFNLSWFPFDANSNLLRLPINLDRYFVRWRPLKQSGWSPEFKLTVGKALNPLPESQLLFDEDVSFSGLQESLSWRQPMPHLEELRIDLGQHPLLMQDTFITSSLLSGKVRSDWRWGDWGLRAGGSYNHYLGSDRFAPLNFNQGYLGAYSARNRINGDVFRSQFQILNLFSRLTWNGLDDLPISLMADYARNFGAADQNNGGLLGLRLGQLREAGDWQLDYIYRYMQQDFNLSLMIDDFYSGTDVAGHTLRLGHQLTPHNAAHITLVSRQSLSRPDSGHLFILYTSIQQRF